MLSAIRSAWRPDLAVDLGTVNTVMAAPQVGVVLDEPSVVAVEPGSRRIVARGAAVGRLAKQMWGRTPEAIEVVHPLSAGVITDFALCEAMLRCFLRRAAPQAWLARPRVVVTAPGSITPVEKRALYNSLHRAGAREVYLVGEALAAALGAGLALGEPVAQMVCAVGGGTTEVAVFSLGEVVAAQSLRGGGDQMDAALVSHFRRRFRLRIGLATAERLRIELGSANDDDEPRHDEVRGVDGTSGLPRKLEVTSAQVRAALAEPLEAIVEACRAAIDRCPADLAADLVDQGLLLAGGAGLLRGLDRFLAHRLGLPVRRPASPQSLSATGAAACLEHFGHWRALLESSHDDV